MNALDLWCLAVPCRSKAKVPSLYKPFYDAAVHVAPERFDRVSNLPFRRLYEQLAEAGVPKWRVAEDLGFWHDGRGDTRRLERMLGVKPETSRRRGGYRRFVNTIPWDEVPRFCRGFDVDAVDIGY